MRQISKLAVIILLSMVLMGCIETDTVIKIKPDGSGTVEETFLMNKEVGQMMGGMMTGMVGAMAEGMAEMGEQMGVDESQEMKQELKQGLKEEIKKKDIFFDEEKLKKKVSEMGEGVSYVSGKKIATAEKEGYKAVYAFADINKLKCNMKSSKGPGKEDVESEKPELVTFEFAKGDPATLIVRMPLSQNQKLTEKPKPSNMQGNAKTNMDFPPEMVKAMFKGMRMSMAIEVEGAIIETNATHCEDSRITLMEMDFDKLLEDEEKFKEFTKTNPQTYEEAKELMADIPGIKVELEPEVKIKFKKGLQQAKSRLIEKWKEIEGAGKIIKVSEFDFVMINFNNPDQIRIGNKFKVFRSDKEIGEVEVYKTTKGSSFAAIKNIIPGEKIREGDVVK